MDKCNILIVDAEKRLVESSSKLIDKHFSVHKAFDGEGAISKLRNSNYCCFILGMRMPGISGPKLIGNVRAAGNNTPAIVMSGGNCCEHKEELCCLGVRAYLQKPFDVDSIEEALKLNCLLCKDLFCGPYMKGCHSKVLEALDYVKEHFQKPLSLTSIGKKLGMSSAYLGRLFKAETGMSFMQFVNIFRIERTIELLYYEDISVAYIMEKSGYNTEQHFYQQFKKHTGCSPAQYKKKLKGNNS